MDRAWALDIGKENSNIIAIGYDEGTVVIKIGSDEPVVSMNNGKLIWAKNLEIFSANLKALNVKDQEAIKDGEKISLPTKDLGTCDLYPTAVKHAPNGHVFALYNDIEYIIYRSQNFKNSGYGSGTDLVWSINGDFAVRDKLALVLYKNNNVQYNSIKPEYVVEELYGGPLL